MVAACALVGLGCGLYGGYRFVTHSPRFAITEIRVTGTSRLDPEAVRAALPVRLGDNVFLASLGGSERALREQPWIASAHVRRVLPHTLVVDIREHEPVAIAALGELYLVEAGGHPFKRLELSAKDGDGLPVVTGLDRDAYRRDPEGVAHTITNAIAAAKRWHADGRPAIGEVHVDAHGGLTLRTYDSGTAIQLGALDAADLDSQLRTFDAAWAELTDLERARMRAIHLDARTDHVTVAFAKD